MERKEIEPIFVYFKRVKTNLKEIGKFVGDTPMELIEKAKDQGFTVIGPQIWNYSGIDGDPDTQFQLDICLPIEGKPNSELDNTMVLESFSCATEKIKGPWTKLKESYEKLSVEIHSTKLSNTMQCREIYHEIDFVHPENCVTEIQVGIKS